MRFPITALALIACAALPQLSSAEGLAARPIGTIAEPLAGAQLAELLQRFGVGLRPRAYAAECLREGDTCTSNEQCCPGLECSGGPPNTCNTED